MTIKKDMSTIAFEAGQRFAKEHPFSEFANDKDSERLMSYSPSYYYADCFKYGCQDIWRCNEELE